MYIYICIYSYIICAAELTILSPKLLIRVVKSFGDIGCKNGMLPIYIILSLINLFFSNVDEE